MEFLLRNQIMLKTYPISMYHVFDHRVLWAGATVPGRGWQSPHARWRYILCQSIQDAENLYLLCIFVVVAIVVGVVVVVVERGGRRRRSRTRGRSTSSNSSSSTSTSTSSISSTSSSSSSSSSSNTTLTYSRLKHLSSWMRSPI